MEVYPSKLDFLSSLVAFEIGNRSTVQFWKDVWRDKIPLKQAYPDLFCFAYLTDAMVADLMSVQNNSVYWEVNFSRVTQDWELEAFSSFFERLYFFTP